VNKMGLFFRHACLLAALSGIDDLASHMAEGFHGDRWRINGGLAIGMVAGALALALALWIVSRVAGGQNRRLACNRPGKLFVSLCRAHRLGWKDAWLLWQLARWQELHDPARLFLEPERFDPPGLGPGLVPHAERLRALRNRLFEGLGEPDSSSSVAVEDQGPPLPIEVAAGSWSISADTLR
jgi:hypothetical protein